MMQNLQQAAQGEGSLKAPIIDFEKAASKFIKKSAKKVDIMDYNYQKACFHPNMEDVIIINKVIRYPKDCEVKEYKPEFPPDQAGEEHKIDMPEIRQKKDMKIGCVFDFDYEKAADQQNQRENSEKNFQSIDPKTGESKHVKDVKFNHEKVPLYPDTSEDTFRKYHYAITFWKTNNGMNPIPFREYAMHWYPLLGTVSISHCGQYLYFIICQKGESPPENEENASGQTHPAKWLVILDINTLLEVAIHELPKFEDYEAYNENILTMELFWNASVLMLQVRNNDYYQNQFMFINLKKKAVEWSFKSQYEEAGGEICWVLSYYLAIKESDQSAIYLVANDATNINVLYLFKVKYMQDPDSLFNGTQFLWKQDTENQFSGADSLYIWYNKQMTQLAIADSDSLGVINFKNDNFSGGLPIKQYLDMTIDSRSFIENSYLYPNILYGFQQGTMTTIYDIEKTPFCQINRLACSDDNELSDYRALKNGDLMCFALKNCKGYYNEEEVTQRIQVKYVKINKEDYRLSQIISGRIQVFVDFMDYNFGQIPGDTSNLKELKENETLFFLSQRKGQCFINMITFSTFIEHVGFKYYQIKQSVDLSQQNFSDIQKVNLIRSMNKNELVPTDYQLVTQTKTSILINHLFSGIVDVCDNVVKNIQFIHKMETYLPDSIFYLKKSGLTVQLKRVQFKGKETSHTVQDCYSVKASAARMLSYEKNRFYILLDNFTIISFALELNQNSESQIASSQAVVVDEKTLLFSEDDLSYPLKEQQTSYDLDMMMVISGSTFYWKDFVFNLTPQSEIKKNKDFFQYEDQAHCDGVVQGPQKLDNPDFILYVTKNFNVPYEPDTQDSEEDDGYPITVVKKTQVHEEEEEKKSIGKVFEEATTKLDENQLLELKQQETYNPNKSVTEFEKTLGIYRTEQKSALFEGDPSDLFSSLQVVLLIPADQAYMQLVHIDGSYQSAEDFESNIVTFSTFIEDRSRVLIIIQGIPMVFNKYGQFICYVDIYDKKIKQDYLYLKQQSMENVIYISDNTRFFMFYSPTLKTYNVFEFMKVASNNYELVKTDEGFEFPYGDINTESNFNTFTLNNQGVASYVKNYQRVGEKQIDQTVKVEEKAASDQEVKGEGQQQQQEQQNQEPAYVDERGERCFRIFMNKDEVTSLYSTQINKFQLVKAFFMPLSESEAVDIATRFGACIIGDYLIVKYDQQLEYMKLFGKDQDDTPTRLNLQINDSCEIKMIHSTGSNDLVQLILKNATEYLIYVITWDLVKNVEYSQVQIDIDFDYTYPEHRIVKGQNPKYNYYCSEHFFYDFQFFFPLKFLKSHQPDNDQSYLKVINQKNVSYDCSEFLDLKSKNTITYSMTLQNLFYFKQLLALDKNERTIDKLILEHFKARINTSTLFHFFFDDQKLLQMLLEEIANAEDDEENIQTNRESLLNILYPNKKGKSAFDQCIKRKSPKITEIYLNMLIELDFVKHYRFSKFIRKHFDVMIEMEISAFYKYLEMGTFRLQAMQKTQKLAWPYADSEVYLQNHSSYLGEDFFCKLQKKKFVPQKLGGVVPSNAVQAPPAAPQKSKELNIMDIYDSTEVEETTKSKTKKVELWALEYEWIFTGPIAKKFMGQLAGFDNDEVFGIETIRVLILYQWSKFFNRIFQRLFVPFLVYFLFYMLYVTLIYEYKTFYPTRLLGLDIAFIVINAIFVIGFACIELRQVISAPLDYFSSFWNWIDILSVVLNGAFIVCDIAHLDPQQQRMIGAASVLIFWLKFYYFLRLFKPTAMFIKMMTQIMSDIKAFGLFLVLAFIAFTNTYFVMAYQGYDPDQGDASLFTGPTFMQAIIYTYLNGLGAFNYSSFDSIPYGQLLWLVWFFEVVIILIILLSLLIAIMTSSFQGVKELGDKNYLKGICALMEDNEFIFNREREFGNAKYVIIAKLEKGQKDEADMESKIWDLKQQFKQIIYNSEEETKQINSDLSEELMEEIKECKDKIENAMALINKEITSFSGSFKKK